jgi:hypothetical protein
MVTYSSALSYLADLASSSSSPRISRECSCWLVMMFHAPRPYVDVGREACRIGERLPGRVVPTRRQEVDGEADLFIILL